MERTPGRRPGLVLLLGALGAPAGIEVGVAMTLAGWLADRRLIMLEPRRVAARAAAGYMARQLGEALGIVLSVPPPDLFGAPRFVAGTWRDYAGLLAGPFATLAPVVRRLGYPDA